jgi:hypothetical protein
MSFPLEEGAEYHSDPGRDPGGKVMSFVCFFEGVEESCLRLDSISISSLLIRFLIDAALPLTDGWNRE